MIAGASSANGQGVEARELASTGPDPNRAVWETPIAAGPNNAAAVYNTGPRAVPDVGWTLATYNEVMEKWEWTQGAFPPGDFSDLKIIDGSVAFDLTSLPGPDRFVAAALGNPPEEDVPRRVLVSSFDPSLGTFEAWRRAVQWPYEDSVDKPWIVAGEVTPNGQEYYIVYMHDPAGGEGSYAYLRSVDGGDKWYPSPEDPIDNGQIKVDGVPVTGLFCAQPATLPDRPLYVAYKPTEGQIGFLEGTDVHFRAPPRVEFAYLMTFICSQGPGEGRAPPVPRPLKIGLNSGGVGLNEYIPGRFIGTVAHTVGQIALDPDDPDVLYVVYQDLATAVSSDVNIYLRVLTRDALGYWCADDPILVNNDTTRYETDQFLPALIVANGHIHIIFYDDRRYTDPQEGQPDEDQQPDDMLEPKWDVFYAHAPLSDLDFQSDPDRNRYLFLDPYDPEDPAALDLSLPDLFGGNEPGEYVGICYDGSYVWTSYMGTHAPDPLEQSVIWSSRIGYP